MADIARLTVLALKQQSSFCKNNGMVKSWSVSQAIYIYDDKLCVYNYEFCRFLAGAAGQDYGKGKTIIFHTNRIDDPEMAEWANTEMAEEGQLIHFSPCDDIGPATFNNGNTFEICVWNGDCRKERLVQDR